MLSGKPFVEPTEASHGNAVVSTVTAGLSSRWKTTFHGIGTIVGINVAGVSKTQIKKQLPPEWCMHCLACHPCPDKVGSYHIRSLHENVAMHEAIRMGDLPPIDPWHGVLEALNISHPQPPQPPRPLNLEPRVILSRFEPTEEEARMIKQMRKEGKQFMDCVTELTGRRNKAIDQRNNNRKNSIRPAVPSVNTAASPIYPLAGT